MFRLLTAIPLLLGQAGQAAAPQADSNSLMTYLPFLWIPLLFYFFLFRPSREQEKKRKQLIDALKKNDRVLTSAGIYGTVASVDPGSDKVVLRVDDDKGVKLTFSKASIVNVVEVSEKPEKPAEVAK